jgi:hypothetical protein
LPDKQNRLKSTSHINAANNFTLSRYQGGDYETASAGFIDERTFD